MGQTHEFSLNPSYCNVGLCAGWDGDIQLLVFYLIFIASLEHIRYVMTSITDVNNMYTVITTLAILWISVVQNV